MKTSLLVVTVVFLFAVLAPEALANPSMLPKHPGYPMGEFKDPVLGMPTANDPGQRAPSHEEALKQAAGFHDAQAVNTAKEIRPNILHDSIKSKKPSSPMTPEKG